MMAVRSHDHPGLRGHLSGGEVTRYPSATAAGADRRAGSVVDFVSDLAHFACHAVSDVDHPSSSHLLLANGRFTVRDIGALHTPDAPYLAFLSACSTGRGSEEFPEEAIHVSSAFQLAGFPHVISTLWSIADDAVVALAEHVYRTLTETPESGPARGLR
jgi:CHAT domain-containing protein